MNQEAVKSEGTQDLSLTAVTGAKTHITMEVAQSLKTSILTTVMNDRPASRTTNRGVGRILAQTGKVVRVEKVEEARGIMDGVEEVQAMMVGNEVVGGHGTNVMEMVADLMDGGKRRMTKMAGTQDQPHQ